MTISLIVSSLTLYFRINSMKQILLSACSKVLLLVKLWGLKIILVDHYLNPNDYTKKVNGSASKVADTSFGGNAMMEWPKIYEIL